MATSEMTPVAEKRKEGASFKSPNQQETRMENSGAAATHGPNSSTKNWPTTMKELVDPKGPFILKWKAIFIVSCVFAVLLDPLFLYIPIINDDIKCLRSDNHLKIAAVVLRSVTDLCYLLNIFFQVYSSSSTNSSAVRRRLRFLPNIANTILIDILAVLPIPQITIVIFYFKMRGSRSFGTRKLMNFFVVVQYVPRVFRIYLSCKEYSMKYSRTEIPVWVKGVLNFFLYILASHVIGAFWYFFAVQQITNCWQYACRSGNGCVPNNLYCYDHHALRNIKFLDDWCSVDTTHEKLFNFGIFLDILELGILGPTNYVEKFSSCFGWGLRNLSSFGSNLKPSINAWENLFANFISIIGLLLFLYLIGNLQTYMQLDTTRLETQRWKMRILKKIETKEREVQQWLSSQKYIPSSKKSEIKSEIMVHVQVELKANNDVDVENIFSILPEKIQRHMESFMPLNRLKKVPLFQSMEEGELREISKYVVPKKYTNEIIIGEKEQFKMMLFIVEGLVIIEMRDHDTRGKLIAGQVYGEKLFSWPAWTSCPTFPVATETARADGDVEALVLMASDIQVDKWPWSSLQSYLLTEETKKKDREVELWLSKNGIASFKKWEIMEKVKGELEKNKDVDVQNILSILPLSLRRSMESCKPLNYLNRLQVPLLQNMDEKVLKEISKYLKPGKYTKNQIIIREKEPLEKMIFIVEGLVVIEMSDCSRTLQLSAEEVYGEKLLTWPAWSSFPSVLPAATESLRADGDVEVMVLSASDIKDIVLKLEEHSFSEEITRRTDDEWELLESDRVTMLRKVSKLKTMDKRVLKAISENLEPMTFERNASIIREGKPLGMMVFITRGSLSLNKDGYSTIETRHEGEFYGEELLDWVLDRSFPVIVPISTHGVRVHCNTGILSLKAKDLGGVVSNFKSYFSKEINIPSSDLCAVVGLTWLKKGPSIFRNMDEEVLKVISEHLKLMSYSGDTFILRENNTLECMFFLVDGSSMSIERTRRPSERRSLNIGEFYGEELVHWITNWASHTAFPNKLPLSKVGINFTGTVVVLVLLADDLKSIVYKFRLQFIKQTTLLVDSKGKLSTFEPLATLRKVPKLEDMDIQNLEKICASLTRMRYNDMSPCIIEGGAELGKMLVIVSGVVSVRSIKGAERVYLYSGDYCGNELLDWALCPSRCSLPKSDIWVEAVGDVEALELKADELKRLGSEFEQNKLKSPMDAYLAEGFLIHQRTARKKF